MTDIANVVRLHVATKLDIPPERVIEGAAKAKLIEVVILGRDPGGEEYFASSISSTAEVMFLLERLRQILAREPRPATPSGPPADIITMPAPGSRDPTKPGEVE